MGHFCVRRARRFSLYYTELLISHGRQAGWAEPESLLGAVLKLFLYKLRSSGNIYTFSNVIAGAFPMLNISALPFHANTINAV